MNAIEIQNVTKQFKTPTLRKTQIVALDDVSFSVRKKEIFGFIGANGAGKTTTIKLILNLIFPTSGLITIAGKSSLDITARCKIGFLPEQPYFYDYLTGKELLLFYGQLMRIEKNDCERRIPGLLRLVNMEDAKNLQLRHYSKGMLQRIGIAQAMISDPELLILDEPMSGLDPVGRKEIRDLLIELNHQGKTIFFSSHIIHDVELLCHRVAFLKKGKLVGCGTVNELIQDHEQNVEINCTIPGQFHSKLPFKSFQKIDNNHIIVVSKSEANVVVDEVRKQKGTLVSLTPVRPTLEELFVRDRL